MLEPTKVPKRVQRVRGGTAANDKYIGPDSEITVDNQRRELRLHDGKKAGGWRIPNLDQLRRLFLTRESDIGNIAFPDEAKGLLARVGKKAYQLRSLVGKDGITVDKADGGDGNPEIFLPARLKPALPDIEDANTALDTGFYYVKKGVADNLPAAFSNTIDARLVVTRYDNEPASPSWQTVYSTITTDLRVFERTNVGGAWSSWYQKGMTAGEIKIGSYPEIYAGVAEVYRNWSAKEISTLVFQMLQSIQAIDSGGVARAYSFNEITRIAGVGAGTTQTIVGPYAFATNDRIEIVAGATAPKSPAGSAVNARIEVQDTGGAWTVLGNLAVTTLPNEDPKSDSVTARFIKTANGYQTADAGWNVTSTVVIALNGNIRITIGAENQIGARVTRWR